MKMKCVRNMYRKKKCCDELLMRVTRTERDEEGPSLLETGPAGGGLGGGDEGGNMTATATNLQRHNALLEAKDLIVEKKLKLVRELKALFLKDIATFRRKAREQHAENERMITEYSTNIASLATELVPVLSQQQEILKLQQKVHDKRLESMKLENMYAHAMKKKGRLF